MSKAYAKTFKAFAAALFAASLALSLAQARADARQKRAVSEKRSAASPGASVVSTRAQYLERVRGAAEALESLAAFCERMSRAEKPEVWSKDSSALDIAQEFPERQKAALERARALMPRKERVESPGGPVEVDNTWLYSSLDDYSKLSDNNKRAAALRSAAQSLRALEARLAEAEGAPAQDKDAERGRLNSILRDPEFNKPPQGNALQRLMEGIRDWLGRRVPRLGGGSAPNPLLSQFAQVLIIGLCVLVLAYVVRRVWAGRARELKSLKLKRRPRVILGERLEADATPADLLAAAEALARAGDLRGAVRKAYVALLCGLGDGGVIRLAQHKTNRDYLDAVRRSASQRLYAELLPLTRGFEQHWYGLRDTTAAEWDDFSSRCRQTLRQF
ncbi:MAG TPA: DUF4129 domain-containing protein [Pyrinomonadaceae bacterium]|jgi:hypothetical protein|nr:DUF4129 domain-containing protein [Pyrinomonadaceae bacterium]